MHPDFLTGVSTVLPFKDFQDIESHPGTKTSTIKRYIVAVVVVASIMTNPTLQRKQSDWSIKVEIRSDYCRGKFALLGGRGLGGGCFSFHLYLIAFQCKGLIQSFCLAISLRQRHVSGCPKKRKPSWIFSCWRRIAVCTMTSFYYVLFAYCIKPLFQCEVKLLIWEWSFIIMQIKIMFTTKVLY